MAQGKGLTRGYRVRIINYPSIGEKRWVNDSRTTDINVAFKIREEKFRTSSKTQYVYQVEEWTKGMI